MLSAALALVVALSASAALTGCLTSKPAEPPGPEEATAATEPVPETEAEPDAPPSAEVPEATLPPPQDAGAAAVRPAPEPVPPEISFAEALRLAARLAPPEVRLLTVGGRVPLLLHDLNRDGRPECIAMAVKDPKLKPADIEALSQSGRVFAADASPVGFALLVYGNTQGSLRKPTVVELGERRVFEALTRTPLNTNRPLPLIITVSFLNPSGREQELLVFDGGLTPRFRRSLTENLSTRSWLEDVDADGVVDILTRERVLEEGVGYETFLTWSRWNGRAFVDVQTRNVLRSLAGFLASLREALLAGDPRRLAELAVEPRELARLRARGVSEAAALAASLGLDKAGLGELPRLTEAVFPEVLEDPFIARDDVGLYFQLTYRLVDENGVVYLPYARLYMLRNPFGDRQFAFRRPPD